MDLVLAVVILGIAEVAILTIALRAFDRAEDRRAAAEASRPAMKERRQAPSRFFADSRGAAGQSERPPVESLLLQLERHVRLEQEAAESFLRNPTMEALHHRAPSPVRFAN